jgi:hypothetical protein
MAREEKRTTSERLKTAAIEAVSPENVKAALANKLLAIGLMLVCLACGIDYFNNDDRVHGAVKSVAIDAGADQVAEAVDSVDKSVDDMKENALEKLPAPIRDNLPIGAFLVGAVSLGAGFRLKVVAAGKEQGRVLRDVGWAVAAPGIVGVLVFAVTTWRKASVLRNTTRTFFAGDKSWSTLADLGAHYAPWAWEHAGGVLVIGLVCVAAALGFWLGRAKLEPRLGIATAILRRTATGAAALALGFYLLATLVAIVSYGGALPIIVWPWKVDTLAFLIGLFFMAGGLALARTGTLELRAQEASDSKKKG